MMPRNDSSRRVKFPGPIVGDDLETEASQRLSAAKQLRLAGEMLLRNAGRLEEDAESFDRERGEILVTMSGQILGLASEIHREARRALRCPSPMNSPIDVVAPSNGWLEPSMPASITNEDPLTALGVTGLLVDLDGTIYTPSGLIPGADDLYAHVVRKKLPFCFVSNTGAKINEHVTTKLKGLTGSFMFKHRPVEPEQIITAAEVQFDWMVRSLPRRARVFVVAGMAPSSNATGTPWWLEGLEQRGGATIQDWDIRTSLTESDAAAWSATAAASRSDAVFVALFSDGSIGDSVDPQTGERGYADWSFDVIKKTSYLLAHGATLVVTAEDAYNPAHDPRFPGHCLTLPGPGMFSAMFRRLMWPLGRNRIVVVGKGGEKNLMIDEAMRRLQLQGHDGDRSKVLIVGDRFDTDIAAGVIGGLKTCLVESGAHHRSLQQYYDRYPADYVCASVADLVPVSGRTVPVDAHHLRRYYKNAGRVPFTTRGSMRLPAIIPSRGRQMPPSLKKDEVASIDSDEMTLDTNSSGCGSDEGGTIISTQKQPDEVDLEALIQQQRPQLLSRHKSAMMLPKEPQTTLSDPLSTPPPPPPDLGRRASSASPRAEVGAIERSLQPMMEASHRHSIYDATICDDLRAYSLRRGRIQGYCAPSQKGWAVGCCLEDDDGGDELALLLREFHGIRSDSSGRISESALFEALTYLGVDVDDRVRALLLDAPGGLSLPRFVGIVRRALDTADLNYDASSALFSSHIHANRTLDETDLDVVKSTPVFSGRRHLEPPVSGDRPVSPPMATISSAIDLARQIDKF